MIRGAAPHRPVRLAVFDCDGTLVDGQASICAAMVAAFAAAGLAPPAPAATRAIIGLSLAEAMAVLCPAADAGLRDRLVEGYKAAFRDLHAAGRAEEPLYDGIADLLGRLGGAGWRLGVATGKSDRGLARVLDGHGLRRHFATLQTADRHPSKPHPAMLVQAMAEAGAEPATTAMIGDTGFDMALARAAGCAAIGVAWGYHAVDELWAAGAAAVAAHPAELDALLAALP